MNKRLKQIIQVGVSLALAGWIFWFLYRDIKFEELTGQIRSSNWFWIGLSLAISLLGFWIRGWRWTLLIREDEGKKVSSGDAYHAVMAGYLANLVVPRAGEVARCGVLVRTNGISMGHLIGTVILERSIDLLFLVGTVFLAFVVERELFLSLAGELVDLDSLGVKLIENLPLFLSVILILFLFFWIVLRRFRQHSLIQKIQQFIRELIGGIKRIGELNNPYGFWLSSVIIWIIYFLTMYTVSLGIQSTANLSLGEVLLVMVMGSIGMVAPVQGGIGTFHALVAFILIQFGIAEEDGKIFAAIIHGTQVILILIGGLISWAIVMKKAAWIKPAKP